jgi:cyclomaltodextrinase
MAGWAEHAIWWQVYPLGFLGAEPRALPADAAPVARLRRLEPWLDYLLNLGCNGLALGPIFASETHGYDTTDYFRVDSRLGSEADLRWLLDACHARGIRVLLDGVFNHAGKSFAPFQDVVARGRASDHADWFHLDWRTAAPGGFEYADFEGHRQLVKLNHGTPAVAGYVASVMEHWLDAGVDGWRLDAAYAVPLPFWREVTQRVRVRHPGAWLVGEVIHGDYTAYVRDGGLDSTTQYELWKAIRGALNDRNFFELSWAMQRHNAFADAFRPLTFVGNHDVTRLASALHDPRHIGHALAVLFTLPGIPSIYAGDEQAFRGVKEQREGGDDAIRPAFPAAPADLRPAGWETYRLHQQLIGLRRRHAWLGDGRSLALEVATEHLAYEVTGDVPGVSVVVLLNAGDQPHAFDLGGRRVRTVLAARAPGEHEPARVDGHGWAILACGR